MFELNLCFLIVGVRARGVAYHSLGVHWNRKNRFGGKYHFGLD